MSAMNREDCLALDAQDELRALRDLFDVPAGKVYLDGNSLGAMPKATAARVADVVTREWGCDLIESWNKAGWIEQPQRIGNKIARLIGAGEGEVVAVDSTSVNLFKVLSVGAALAAKDAPERRVILSERDNFPTDLYIAQSVAKQFGMTLKLVEASELAAALSGEQAEQLGLVMLTHVNYRTGQMHEMAAVTAAVHAAGARMIWDLAHSAGAVPVDLRAAEADFAVGCGYKYLNGGPGAPAFVWVNPRHGERLDTEQLWQPLSGWMGHAAPFAFTTDYQPGSGIQRFVCGTPSALALSALECGVDTVLAAEQFGGMEALRRKSLALSDVFIRLVQQRCEGFGLRLQTPLATVKRGSQVSFYRESDGYAIMQALVARGVVGDYREPGILRFGFTPLYVRFSDVWDAVAHLVEVLRQEEWKQPRFQRMAAVT